MFIKSAGAALRVHYLTWCAVVVVTLAGCGGSGTASTTQIAATTAGAAGLAVPIINGTPPTTVEVGAKYQYIPSVSDANSHPLSYDITNKPDWATFTEATGELSGIPQVSDVGMTADIQIGVSDGTSRATVGPFRIRIVAAGSAPPVAAPTIAGTPAATVTIGHVYSFTPTVSAAATDVLSFVIVNRPSWATFSTATGQLSGTPTSANEGSFANILISVSGESATVSLPIFSIEVQPAGSNAPLPESIAIAPLVLRLAPAGTQQLTVTATYSDGTTQSLAAAAETFQSSNTSVASVSAGGVVTVAANAALGATAMISATDTASGKTTANAASAQVTVTAPGTVPTPNSRTAALATAQNNAVCGTPVIPFYWEIGDQTGALVSGSQGSDANGPVLATTKLSIASASKWIYATYVTQVRGSAAQLSAQDVNFLHFTSGYTNMSNANGTACPATNTPDTANECLTLTNAQGVSFAAQDPTTVGKFDYNGGHMENHASQMTSLGNVDVGSLGPTMQTLLGAGVSIVYTEPLMSGGIYTTANDYALVLRHILDQSLAMHDALGTNAVCTRPSATCNAVFSPILEAWHYSIGHWVEDDPSTKSDGAFSSPGAFGFYPWIDSTKTFYGVISRSAPSGTGEQQGYASAQCGRLIRHAWMTGIEQTQPLPTN
jgi:hypothetical protein